jgi:hypothetical protein
MAAYPETAPWPLEAIDLSKDSEELNLASQGPMEADDV